MEKLESSNIGGENVKISAALKTFWQFLKGVYVNLTYDLQFHSLTYIQEQ